ncbi:MAG: DUF853 domain-containing protein [Clostridiales bacterium]|nr:DUF853 domain-containing protein [Clostridiales bacterium]
MLYENTIWLGSSSKAVCLLPEMANRHGLITGATGTGKTVTLQVLAEGFSSMGVPVFLADVKGDLSGMVKMGENTPKISDRLAQCGVPSFQFRSFPAIFWDVYGEQGHPVRATVSQMGPVLLGRMLGLNDTQCGVLNIVFRIADHENMLLLDIKDLKAMLKYVGEHAKDYTLEYGNVSTASIGAIQRAVAVLEDQGGDRFFGEPALNMDDWMGVDEDGRGNVNILAADRLFRNPTMYSTFLLWLLSELYERLPEAGDLAKPRMVFFFDEAHLLFNNCTKSLLEKVEQVVRLIRSKGVGIFFISQSPSDIPMTVLGQLGNRIQHALRAYTPLDQKAVKVAAQTFRANPSFDTEAAIQALQTGEALISLLDSKGAPAIVERAKILPPQSYIGAVDEGVRQTCIETSPYYGIYEQVLDRVSAYEMLESDMESFIPGELSDMPSLVYNPDAASPVSEETESLVYAPDPVLPVQETAAPVSAPAPSAPHGFMIYDPKTGGYVKQEIPALEVKPFVNTSPAPAQAPVLQVQEPTAAAVTEGTEMPVLIYDSASGQYVQKMVRMVRDPATGKLVPVQPENAAAVNPKAAAAAAKEAEKERKAAEKAEKDRIAEERRKRAEELREERAERARKNDSLIGRIQNTAISTATREVTRQITRGILGGISGILGTKKK